MIETTCVNVSDETAAQNLPRNITLRAMRGCAIVWFMPYRYDGQIEIPEKHREQSVEAIMIDDATGYGLSPGTKVIVSRCVQGSEYFEIEGQKFCRVPRKALYLIDSSHAA